MDTAPTITTKSMGNPRPKSKKCLSRSLVVFAIVFAVAGNLMFLYEFSSLNCIREYRSTDTVYRSGDDYELAREESMGFFQDVTSQDWERLRSITLNRTNVADGRTRHAQTFYQNNWDPDFSCRHDTKVGGSGDGTKWVCDPPRIADQARARLAENGGGTLGRNNGTAVPGCLVYSIGSQGNFQFETGVSDSVGPGVCEIHTFDFGDYAKKVPPGSGIHYHSWGLKPSYETNFEVWGNPRNLYQKNVGTKKFLTLKDTMEELGHVGRPIDIFKIDCEGCEWITYKDWITADIRQLLLEVHSVPQNVHEFFEDLQKAGFVTFHKEPNIQYGGGQCVEYAMIKLNRTFVEDRIMNGARKI